MEAIVRLIAGVVVTIEMIFGSFVNHSARIISSPELARSFWRAGLAVDYPDRENPHADEWARYLMLHDRRDSIRRSAGIVWVQVSKTDEPQDVEHAFMLLNAAPRTIDDYNRDIATAFLMKHSKNGMRNERTFAEAVNLASRPGWINQYEAARLLGTFGDSKHRTESVKILTKIMTDKTLKDANWVAQESIAKISGHRPHYDGEMFCDKHPLIIAGKRANIK